MTKFINAATILWLSVRESLMTWMILISILLVLLLVFRCFTSPVKLSKKKLRMLLEKIRTCLPEKKSVKELEEDIPFQKLRELGKDSLSCHRLLLAYYYDHGEDMKIKAALLVTKKIKNGMEAAKSESIREDRKAMCSLMRNMEAQTDAAIKMLDNY